eukprot:2757648-Pleurochrysis_carterae.AAC.1
MGMRGPKEASSGALSKLAFAATPAKLSLSLPIAGDKVLEVRLSLEALQATSKYVEMVELKEEGAIGEARTVVRWPAEAH